MSMKSSDYDQIQQNKPLLDCFSDGLILFDIKDSKIRYSNKWFKTYLKKKINRGKPIQSSLVKILEEYIYKDDKNILKKIAPPQMSDSASPWDY